MSLMQTDNNSINVERRSAGYHPSIWGEYFLTLDVSNHTNNIHEKEKQVEKLKSDVKNMLMSPKVNMVPEKLNLIDQIQRMGIAYHFEKEISEVLMQIHRSHFGYEPFNNIRGSNHDLYTSALLFRLLREQGHNISCDIFKKFKNSEGSFDDSLMSDARGLLSLYEASHLRVRGESILDEAMAFTVSHLNSLLDDAKLNPLLAAQVSHALKHCLRKGLPRLQARQFIQIHQSEDPYRQILLTLAKIDFNLLQKQHQKELSDITRWWKGLMVEKNFSFARDRITECYFWILGVYFEPEYSLARNILTKVISLTSIMDDIYDVYGTIEELQLLTNAINKWDLRVIDELPDYMQVFYRALLDVYTEIEEKLEEQGRLYRLPYAKEAMKNQATAYFKEAQWFNQNYTPQTMDEYMSIALETSGYGLLATTSFLGMGDVASIDAFNWLCGDPKILNASKIVGRLRDDIISRKLEQERGHVVSAVECYMTQHGVTEREAEEELRKQADDAWKDINRECLSLTDVPMVLLTRILNFTRMIEVLYKDKDCYTHSTIELKGYIDSVLVNPITL